MSLSIKGGEESQARQGAGLDLVRSGRPVQHHEMVLEWTYIFRFQGGAYFIQPDVQYILDSSGTGDIPNALVVGTQVGVNFQSLRRTLQTAQLRHFDRGQPP